MENYLLNEWEQGFIKCSIERELEINDNENFKNQEDYNNYTKKLQDIAHKFKLDFLDE